MSPSLLRYDSHVLAILARLVFVALLTAVVLASLAPADLMPWMVYSSPLEHIVAFYAVTLTMTAARYRTGLWRLTGEIITLATVLEGIRAFSPAHGLSSVQDLACDFIGALAALAPMFANRFRASFLPRAPRE